MTLQEIRTLSSFYGSKINAASLLLANKKSRHEQHANLEYCCQYSLLRTHCYFSVPRNHVPFTVSFDEWLEI